ncbi:MAG: hypothetical protein OEW90_00915 [Betaproteobacteria bacterium]|nr:hypothetical protein [Betaproteobacteria bacterium]MDH4322678.1 hypothetical protein [Betaproteobacteria bacterium]
MDKENKPQIIMQDFGGEHSANLAATRSRLIKGASWKRQRVVVVVPMSEAIPAKVMLSYWNLAFAPNNGVAKIVTLGEEVGIAYSSAVEAVLAHPELKNWEFMLTLEHDNAPPPDGLINLIAQMEAHPEFACIGGLYFTKGPQGVAQIWGDPKIPQNYMPQIPTGGLQECCGTGMGFSLFRMKMFKDGRLRKPWFVTQRHGGVATQDLYFWSDARKYGYRCAVDCSVRVGHYDWKGEYGPPDKMY